MASCVIMRIAMITDSYHPTRDGVVTSVDITKKGLEDLGHEVVVVAPDPGEKQRIEGVRYFKARAFKQYPGYYLPIFPSNKIEILREIDADVIHIHGIAVNALKGMIAARALKLPAVITFHTMVSDTLEFYSPIKLPGDMLKRLSWIYVRRLIGRADAVICPTPSILRELSNAGVDARRTVVIPTGIDTNIFTPGNGGKIRERYSLGDSNVAVCIGRLSFEKNIELLMRSMEHIDGHLMIVGKGPAGDSLKALARELGIENKMIFTGFVADDELVDHYRAGDICVSASAFETQGLSVLEAMSCGLPVACMNARAFSDIIVDGENGYFFDSTEESCASAVKRCFEHKERLNTYARLTAKKYSIQSSAAALEKLYGDVIVAKRDRLQGKKATDKI